mmetsp:Transcript_23557/g.79849  ORF Transcript_23557/g.79849 Transcript_23557/m.79849 type:complete len:122 (-) Transcript_23557:31-396(-)
MRPSALEQTMDIGINNSAFVAMERTRVQSAAIPYIADLSDCNQNRAFGSNMEAFGGDGVYQSAVGHHHIPCCRQRLHNNRTLRTNVEAFGGEGVYQSAGGNHLAQCSPQCLNKTTDCGIKH